MEEVGAVLGTIMGKSVWALPLLLNGDSAGAKGYDIPLTTTDEPGSVEFFYRAMSTNEYLNTGGFLQQKRDQNGHYRGEGPFVTDRLEYAERALNGFSKKDKYNMIVQYTVQSGTTNLLNSISLPHGPGGNWSLF